jgi:leucyl aminopeptidase (aminopeptidase T)
MPLYMDVHDHVEGLTAQAAAEAHKKDLETQAKHGATYHRYWYDTESGKVFCLVEAPSKDAAEQVHREAYGLVADHIYEVNEGS